MEEKKYSDESLKRIEKNLIKNDILPTITANAMQSINHQNCALVEEKIAIKNATKQGYLLGENGDGVDISGRMATHRGTVQKGLCQTLKANPDTGVITNDNYINKTLRIRKLTPCECIKLMGFEEDDYKSMKEYGLSDSAIYHCAGDSIVSTCIMSLLASMFEKDHREIVNNYVDELVKDSNSKECILFDDRDKGFGVKTSEICPTQRASRGG